MLSPVNVATPSAAATVWVPSSNPLDGLAPMLSVTLLLSLVRTLPKASSTSTLIDDKLAPAAVLPGSSVITRFGPAAWEASNSGISAAHFGLPSPLARS